MQNNEIRAVLRHTLNLILDILPVAFWLFLIYAFDEPYAAGLTLIAAFAHECGHIYYSMAQKRGCPSLRGRIFGFGIKSLSGLKYREEILLYLSGPSANLASSVIATVFFPYSSIAKDFALINVMTALTNLLPIKGYDGYGALRAAAASRQAERFSSLLPLISFLGTALISFFALYVIERYNGGYWIFAVFLFNLISDISSGVKSKQSGI